MSDSRMNNSLLIRLVIFGLVLSLVVGGGYMWWQDGVSPVDPTDEAPVAFSVSPGESVRSIAQRLSQEKLIRSRTGFYILVRLMNLEKNVEAGDFRLNRMMDARTIALELTHGMSDVRLTIPEGWRNEEVAAKVAYEFDIPEQEFLKFAKQGYMFPDTYQLPKDATASAIASLLFETFEKKITPVMRNDAKKTGLSFDQVITLASLVEREGRTNDDRPMIAGILLNRIQEDRPLQVDATLQYILGYQPTEKTWWKKILTDEDKKLVSAYNTYLHPGLPPGPIANPGLDAIRAVIYPQASPYFFYLHDPSGVAHYAVTLEEHNENVRKYLQ